MRVSFPQQWARLSLAMLVLSLAVFSLAWFGIFFTRENDRIAAVWLANGAIVAALLVHARRDWMWLLGASSLANFMANLFSGDALGFAATLAIINQLESLLVALAVHPLFASHKRIDDLAVVVRLLLSAVAACALSAALAGSFVALWTGATMLPIFSNWFLSDSLGLLVVVPLLLSFRAERECDAVRDYVEPIMLVVGSALLSGWVFWQTAQPLLFTLALVVFYAALRLRLFGAMVVVCAVSVAGLLATLSGHGIIAHANLDPTHRMYVFQLFVAVQLFSVLPIRALVFQRDMLGLAAAESDRLFRRIAEASPAGILHLDVSGRPTFSNGRWSGLTGMPFDALTAENWLDPIDREYRSAARSLWARARATDRELSDEFRLADSGGAPRWAELNIYPEIDGSKLLGFVVRLADVTARRNAEDALMERETLYRLVTENAHDAVLRLDAGGKVLYASSALQRSFGIFPADLVGRNFREIIFPGDLPAALAVLSPIDEPCDPTVRFRIVHGAGRPVWIEAGHRPLLHPQSGKLVETVVSLRDIDRRRQQELKALEIAGKLRERNRLLNMAEELAEVGHWRFDLATGELDCSRLTRAIANVAAAPRIRPPDALGAILREDRHKLLRAIAVARRSSRRQVVAVRITDGQNVRHVRLAVQADLDPNGKVTGLFGVVRDKSEFVHAQQQLIEARDEAQAAARAKSHFLATMSHEIRTPMTGVLGMIELLRDEPDEAERNRYFSTLKQSANLLMAVLDDVLDFSKIDSGALRLDRTSFNLGQLIASTVELFGNAASRKGILLSYDFDGHDDGVVADPVRVQQVVSNLLSNAIKFTQQGEVRVRLSASKPLNAARLWTIEVSDSGIGIAGDAIANLFQPFVQAESSTARKFGGTGLGLAISRRLVDAMGGELDVRSTVGVGSTFYVRMKLPDAEVSKQTPRIESRVPATTGSTHLDILVAEDNPVNQLLIGAILKRLGHRADIVENGLQAVGACRSNRYDVVLMDMQMPEMDGLAATRAIRSIGGANANVPIVALTADASPERRRFYDGVGLTHFMTKPIDQEQLAALLFAIAAEMPDRSRKDSRSDKAL